MALTADEEELERVALGALPRWIASEANVREAFAAFAAQVGAGRAQTTYWLREMAHPSTSTGVTAPDVVDYLNALAQDRGTKRAPSETDAELRYRLRNPSDAVNYPSLLSLVNGILTAAGVSGTAVMYDLRSNRAFFGDNEPQTGTGGVFALVTGTTYKFTPDAGWEGNKPPYVDPTRVDIYGRTYEVTISGAANAGNNGTFPITGISADGATFVNATGVAATDATVTWRVDRYNWNDVQITPSTGISKSYLSRGFRMGGTYPTIQIILPAGTLAATENAVIEALRTKKAAGVRVVTERRTSVTAATSGYASAEAEAFGVTCGYAGSLPDLVSELNTWTGESFWTAGHNYTAITGSPNTVAAMSDGVALGLSRLGTTDAAVLALNQSSFIAQGGCQIRSGQEALTRAASADWKMHATDITYYIATVRFDGTPTSGQVFFGGTDGANGGWYMEAHATSGIRVAYGSGASYVYGSYVGGTSFYDGGYHTVLLALRPSSSRAKLITEFGDVETTGLTLSSGNALIAIGALTTGGTWGNPVSYLVTGRGTAANSGVNYNKAETMFDAYEAMRVA